MVQPDGHIILGGEFISYDKGQDIYSSRILRMDTYGNLDLDFVKRGLAHKFTSDVNAILQLPDGKVLVGCSNPFSRIDANGNHDTDFLLIAGRAFSGDINTLALQPDGKVIVAGRFNAYKGIKVGNIVRLNPDGTMDERFVSGSYK
jgi:WD40 repeat protein